MLWDKALHVYYHFAINLGLDQSDIQHIEHKHVDDLVLKVFFILVTWYKKAERSERTFNTILKAAEMDNDKDMHILCRVCNIYMYMYNNYDISTLNV